MKEEEMLYCLIAFILGWLVSRQMGNGFSVGGGTRCAMDMLIWNTHANKYAKETISEENPNGIQQTEENLKDYTEQCESMIPPNCSTITSPWCKPVHL